MNSPNANSATRQPWLTHLEKLAARALGKASAHALIADYGAGFTEYYRNLITPRYALQDLLHLQQIQCQDKPQVSLVRSRQTEAPYRLHFYSQEERYLDEYLPIMENTGLRVIDQVQFCMPTAAGKTLFIKSFTIKATKNPKARLEKLRGTLIAAIASVMTYQTENDALNKLTLLAGMAWQAIDTLRAYRNYFLQLNLHSTRASFHRALINNPEQALCLFHYFEARFRPNPAWADMRQREEHALMPVRLQLLNGLANIADANDDRILRSLFNLIDATVRSNFHSRIRQEKFFIAIKINSLGVIDMPSPRPHVEIYVHAAAMEGIHLRGGKISRGGIRWSDRPDDFRTEILGLMQTQISKNALIIPTGAKGGFVLKKNGGKNDTQTLALQAYTTFIEGLLDLTDNYQNGKIVPVPERVCYDDPDPYLVVAADKGTAPFSDLANSVAAHYQFWLRDAFASGGSRGYDHKALGITARGAWECVKRHFCELGKDIQHQAFTVVGIGSMDGDVFGNGMLLSPFIRLKAAFSGQHIFLDPAPPSDDCAFLERQRLFSLAGSSWHNYDRNLLSSGGGVFLRSDPNIPIAPEIRQWLGIHYQTLDGDSLIRYLLAAETDLLWLGGIGTYVKASGEKHAEVGDPHNATVRINANDLKALVVGEGANLGFTQKARIEYALQGGRINTDAVDNSAGVDTSDHEVNLKILLMHLQEQNQITDYQPLFNAMTEAVCQLVLANNIAQSHCLSLEQRRCQNDVSAFIQLAERLDAGGFLDRELESFPTEKQIQMRPGHALTRPELAVLMAASKMYLTRQIEDQTALLHDDCCQCYLASYFPEQLSFQFKDQLASHPLAERITATVISNKIINQAGCLFLTFGSDDSGHSLADSVAVYLSFEQILNADALRQTIVSLHSKTNTEIEKTYRLRLQLEQALLKITRASLFYRQNIRPYPATIESYLQHIEAYRRVLFSTTPSPNHGLQETLDFIDELKNLPLLIDLCERSRQPLSKTAALYHNVIDYFGLKPIFSQLNTLITRDPWELKLLSDLPDSIDRIIGQIVNTLFSASANRCTDYFDLPENKQQTNRYRKVYQEVLNAHASSLLPYIVLEKTLGQVVRSV